MKNYKLYIYVVEILENLNSLSSILNYGFYYMYIHFLLKFSLIFIKCGIKLLQQVDSLWIFKQARVSNSMNSWYRFIIEYIHVLYIYIENQKIFLISELGKSHPKLKI